MANSIWLASLIISVAHLPLAALFFFFTVTARQAVANWTLQICFTLFWSAGFFFYAFLSVYGPTWWAFDELLWLLAVASAPLVLCCWPAFRSALELPERTRYYQVMSELEAVRETERDRSIARDRERDIERNREEERQTERETEKNRNADLARMIRSQIRKFKLWEQKAAAGETQVSTMAEAAALIGQLRGMQEQLAIAGGLHPEQWSEEQEHSITNRTVGGR